MNELDSNLFDDNLASYLLRPSALSDGSVVVGPDQVLSYRTLASRVTAISEHLRNNHPPGTAVGVLAGNSTSFIASYLGILKSGCVAVLLDRNAPPEVLEDEILRASVSHVLAETAFREKLDAFDVRVDDDESLAALVLPDPETLFQTPFTGRDRDPAVIFFTSGTTARRKGVILTHRAIIANTESIIAYLSLTPTRRECACVVLPFHHVGGASVLHSHLRVGGEMVLFNGILSGSVVSGMLKHDCTSIFGVPSTFAILVRNMGMTSHTYPSLRYVAQGGGIMSLSLVRELKDGLPGVDFICSYGQTEAASRISYLRPELVERKLGSIGKGMPGMEVRVVNESGENVKPGEIGEIIARGENIMIGYLGDPQATSEILDSGWLRTRDAATVDDEGYVYPKYRIDGVINSGGYRVSPEEVENLIQSVESVTHCGVVGVPHIDMGEAIVAYLSTDGDPAAVLGDVRAICARSLPSHKRPLHYKVLDALPLNSSTKLDREALRLRAAREFGEG